MKKIILAVATAAMLTGCSALNKGYNKMMGVDYEDPNRSLALIHIQVANGHHTDATTFTGHSNGKDVFMFSSKSAPTRPGCTLLLSVFEPDRYSISHINDITASEKTVFQFTPGDPENLTFDAEAGQVQYLGGYFVGFSGGGEFDFQATDACGGEATALGEFKALVETNNLTFGPLLRDTIWPGRVQARLGEIR
ncbi:hypothetical protein [Microbulbifer aggregans]|uniref:hypothetical protein n=1 Tax=Microbulbifer aggregans TaxID=1769779 RepID=UPI001CFD9278|nr:hypothetical protein [Microbulbifer aggregans]